MEGSTSSASSSSRSGGATPLIFFLNGKKVEVERPDPAWSLAEYLRTDIGLTGTKVGCGRGLCGACTVMVSTFDPATKEVKHRSLNACLAPLCSLDHAAVTTIEGLGNTRTHSGGSLHPIQERFTQAHASQCGFCTPGMVMAFYSLWRSHPEGLTEEDIKKNLDGNLCRCTGYRPILDAMRSFTKNSSVGKRQLQKDEDQQRIVTASLGIDGTEPLHPLNLTSEPIFPPFLMNNPPRSLHFQGDNIDWFRPTTLDELLSLKRKYPNALVMAGNTRLVNRQDTQTVIISVTHVPELRSLTFDDNGVTLGAATSINTFRDALINAAATLDKSKTAGFTAIAEQLGWIAGNQVRNAATVGGSIIAGHIWGGQEASDITPPLVATNSTVTILSAKAEGGKRVSTISDFVLGQGKVNLKEGELLVSIHVPFSKPGEFVQTCKHAARQTSAASHVTAAISLVLEGEQHSIREATLCFGGLGYAGKRAPKTEQFLVGKKLEELKPRLQEAFAALNEDYPTDDEYRRALAAGVLFKFYNRIYADAASAYNPIPKYQSVITEGRQKFLVREPESEKDKKPEDKLNILHQPTPHIAGALHTTGEAVYTDDIPAPAGTLYSTLVLSTKAHAKLVKVDASQALAQEGVVAFFTAKDIPKNVGEALHDGVTFAEGEVTFYGQPIGVIVADTKARADRAARLVKIEYSDLPALITIKDAIAADSYFQLPPFVHDKLNRGDVEAGLKASDVVVEGELELGGAYHFYMEPHSALVIPRDDGGLTIHATAQGSQPVQDEVSHALELPHNKIDVRIARLGGGFGGKGSRFFNETATALAARLLNKPVRGTLDRRTDLSACGTRAPYYFKYRAGATRDGKLQALDFQVYSNGGNAIDFSGVIIGETLAHIDGCYSVPNFRAQGKVVKTNIVPTKPYRGAGVPQAIVGIEFCMDHLARKMQVAPHILREANFYKEGDSTPPGDTLENVLLGAAWSECRQQSDFDRRAKEAVVFNNSHKFKKRGLAMIPVKYGIASGTLEFFMKCCGMVHIMGDGTIVVHHGGIEMGQGLNSKIIQIAAQTLGVPASKVMVPQASSETLALAGFTGGSIATDFYGQAVLNACQELNKRLQPLRESEALKDKSWEQLIQAANFSRVCLSAYGYYAPSIGRKFLYYTWGAAAAEVELDILSGAHRILRVDMVQDVGRSLNPALDIGQCEGAFVQGIGWLTSEELRWDKEGKIDENYEIPMVEALPHEYHVTLMKDTIPNPRVIFSAKGVGEPPKVLAACVPLAIKDAINAARQQSGLPIEDLVVDLPLTVERIRLACGDLNLAVTSSLTQQPVPDDKDKITSRFEE